MQGLPVCLMLHYMHLTIRGAAAGTSMVAGHLTHLHSIEWRKAAVAS
jgi:hypothetical protein